MLFALNMVFMLCYFCDIENLNKNQIISFDENAETGEYYYYIQQ